MKKIILLFCFLYSTTTIFAQENTEKFSLCENLKTYPYYHPDITYKGDFWVIKEHFKNNYPIDNFKKMSNNSGIITIQFKINCKGKTGDFKVRQCDLNYKKTILNESISNYFLNKTKALKDWIPAKDEDGNTVNSHKFFSFKLNKGKLVEILPK
ncbi:MAG: hypothetical protein HRT73_04600 [Flavobacteriales bacterium]|nr:hypothetical protein [Flavobacteriales bacterium]